MFSNLSQKILSFNSGDKVIIAYPNDQNASAMNIRVNGLMPAFCGLRVRISAIAKAKMALKIKIPAKILQELSIMLCGPIVANIHGVNLSTFDDLFDEVGSVTIPHLPVIIYR